MIKRIVKLTFRPEGVQPFLEIFAASSTRIASFPGCSRLELLRDADNPCVFFTLSIWDKPSSLESYRTSALFTEVWSRVKPLFADRPAAWTVKVEWESP